MGLIVFNMVLEPSCILLVYEVGSSAGALYYVSFLCCALVRPAVDLILLSGPTRLHVRGVLMLVYVCKLDVHCWPNSLTT